MSHPLAPDLTQLSLEDLEKNRTKLNENLWRAHSTGNSGLIHQLQMLLGDYDVEMQVRQAKLLATTNSAGSTISDQIDIGR